MICPTAFCYFTYNRFVKEHHSLKDSMKDRALKVDGVDHGLSRSSCPSSESLQGAEFMQGFQIRSEGRFHVGVFPEVVVSVWIKRDE